MCRHLFLTLFMVFLHLFALSLGLSIDVFKRYLKTFLLLSINTTLQRIRNIVPLRYINSLID